ncbi:MAG: hypothetical protein ABIR62_09400 [Dokdonella sp.]|uniref:hypothetical protein n=1 Tax=Dokdonella sp. TaxID=2291710 RepID=UPI003263F4C0
MTNSKVTIFALILALATSNGWWLYHSLDVGVVLTHQDVSLRDNREALAQVLAILPLVIHSGADRPHVLMAASGAAQHFDSFEKDGYVWVGALGLKFDDGGHLLEAVRAWQ